MSVIYTNDLETGLAHERPEVCKPIPRVISKSKVFTSLLITIPMGFMFILFLYFEYGVHNFYFQGIQYDFQEFRPLLLYPVVLITGLTTVSGTVSLVSIYYGFHNIITVCSYVYSAIAYWLIINTLIITFCTWDYLNHDVIGYAFLWSSIASFIWLFSSAVMDAYSKNN